MDDALSLIATECTGIQDTLTNEQVLSIYDRIKFYQSELKTLRDRAESAMMEWIKVNGDLVVSDSVRYYVGTSKTTKCTNIPGAVEKIMEATGGDFTRFCDVLASGAIKHGAAKKVLDPKTYAELFKVTESDKLEEGVLDKKLIRYDEAFVKIPTTKGGVSGPTAAPSSPETPAGNGGGGTGSPAPTGKKGRPDGKKSSRVRDRSERRPLF